MIKILLLKKHSMCLTILSQSVLLSANLFSSFTKVGHLGGHRRSWCWWLPKMVRVGRWWWIGFRVYLKPTYLIDFCVQKLF